MTSPTGRQSFLRVRLDHRDAETVPSGSGAAPSKIADPASVARAEPALRRPCTSRTENVCRV